MPTLRSLADLGVPPRLIEVVDHEHVVGRIIAHGDQQFDAFDLAGRPIGTFPDVATAESAIRAECTGGA